MSDKELQHNNISGGSIGGIFNGGNHGTVILNSQPPEEPSQTYTAKVGAKLPTQNVLAIVTSLIGVATFVTGWQSLQTPIRTIRGLINGKLNVIQPHSGTYIWMVAFALSVTILAVLIAGLRLVRSQTFRASRLSLLPAVAGMTDDRGRKRLALVRFAGNCMRCGGKLRFYDKPTQWHYEIVAGRRRKIIDDSVAAAECKNDRRHWYELEVTDPVF